MKQTETIDIQTVLEGMLSSPSNEQRMHLLQEVVLATSDSLHNSLERPYVDSPLEAVSEEALRLLEESKGRACNYRGAYEFVTRTMNKQGIDTRYSIESADPIAPALRITTLLRGQLVEPCTVVIKDVTIDVYEKYYRNGRYEEIKSPRPEKLLPALGANMIWATSVAIAREKSGDRAAEDAKARVLLGNAIKADL